ncbi:hypothetical protein [uncultured Micrococcus sp.]|uniref:hypothetical protein n=1 Tax=uncultured Micrococcus sp. TaxID=114051 RepID=UPI002593D436|nr:hypothetical protein [uncultured Micrococcus sp.]
MSGKRVLTAVTFALIAAGLYWLKAELDVTVLRRHTVASSGENVDFDWGTCLLVAGVGALLGILPGRRSSGRETSDDDSPVTRR